MGAEKIVSGRVRHQPWPVWDRTGGESRPGAQLD
jgi:hypothetical protein